MDDMKLSGKNENKFETLIKEVRIYSQNIGMAFNTEKRLRLKAENGTGQRKYSYQIKMKL